MPAATPPPSALRALLTWFVLATLLVCTVALYGFQRNHGTSSLLETGNLVGPTAGSLLHGNGLSVTTGAQNDFARPIAYHSARMPLASFVVAGLTLLLGAHSVLAGTLLKTILFLLPIWFTAYLLLRQKPSWLVFALLLLPFFCTVFIADAINLQVEEGYAYSLLAAAFALCLLPARFHAWTHTLTFCLCITGLLLSKSSLLLVAFLLGIAFCLQVRRTSTWIAVMACIVLTPLAWATWQYHASGRFTMGTSLDGENLHKGNHDAFLSLYPPHDGITLDSYDPELNRNHTFHSEWEFNDWHRDLAVQYIRTHPRQDIIATWRKFMVFFLLPRKVGSDAPSGARLALETFGVVLFRLCLWAAAILSLRALIRCDPALRRTALLFLLLCAAAALPYMAGFAYTRHASVLFYPAVVVLAAGVISRSPGNPSRV